MTTEVMDPNMYPISSEYNRDQNTEKFINPDALRPAFRYTGDFNCEFFLVC